MTDAPMSIGTFILDLLEHHSLEWGPLFVARDAAIRREAQVEAFELPFGFVNIIAAADEGLKEWAMQPHNKKWWKRIDGTPIPNDLLVNVTQAIWKMCKHANTNRSPDPNYRERIVAQARLDEAEWWAETVDEPPIPMQRLERLRADLARLATDAEKEGK